MALPDLTGLNIQDTYQRLLQRSGSGDITDGTGSLFIPPTASFAISASYAVSASHEIIKEISSSHADIADGLTGQPSIHVTNITASGNISSSGTIEAQDFLLGSVGTIKVKDTSGNTDDTAVINLADTAISFGDTDIQTSVQGDTVVLDAAGDVKIDSATGLIRFQDSTVDSIVFNAQNGVGQITASGDISSSGEIIGIINGGTF